LAEAGVGQQEIDKIFLTHLHSDHILSMPDILLTGWTLQGKTPVRVWGPPGTKDNDAQPAQSFRLRYPHAARRG
jgi:ribonuclease Z